MGGWMGVRAKGGGEGGGVGEGRREKGGLCWLRVSARSVTGGGGGGGAVLPFAEPSYAVSLSDLLSVVGLYALHSTTFSL